MSRVILKEGREKSLLQRHPWIFSGAVAKLPNIEPGEVLSVYSSSGNFLAKAYFHPDNSLSGRVLTFENEPIDMAIQKKLDEALSLRKFDSNTTAYRLVNAEGDGLPGLIVDKYANTFVVQFSTYGMERLKPLILEKLIALKPDAIYEKSSSSARAQEGLNASEGILYGNDIDEVEVLENGIKFLVSLKTGQKTGLFLDQRERRKEIGQLARDKRVLNCFSYTSGFSLYALNGGAKSVDSVDSCRIACEYAQKNTELNGLSHHTIHCEDVFTFLKREKLDYNLFILDPPAFAKKRTDIPTACLGYKTINRLVMEKAPRGSLLLTCSCSYFIDEKLFQTLLFQSAQESGRTVRILNHHAQASDHPISIFHPEGEYLKSFLLHIF